jgi:hypothetical protein
VEREQTAGRAEQRKEHAAVAADQRAVDVEDSEGTGHRTLLEIRGPAGKETQ